MLPAFPSLPKPITSFGAAVLNGAIYVYGGFEGTAHHYYNEGQSGDLVKLAVTVDAQPEGKWDPVATGPRLQGLALVSRRRSALYRIGGFEARNKEADKQDLWSRADCVRFDPKTSKWHELPPMPSARSSFDAAVAGDSVYVVGGWIMRGDQETVWQETAYSLNLATAEPAWEELPKPPFKRRALSVGSFQGRIYAVGGMQPEGKVTRQVDVYSPTTRQWTQGPELPGEAMEGFGTSCCSAGDRFYVSTSSGKLLRLSDDGKSWELVRQLATARFFHRMLGLPGGRLISLAGANMHQGKYDTVELLPTSVEPPANTAQ